MSDLSLYFSPGACSRVPLIQLEQAGAAYALHRVDASRGETRTEAFRRLNPKGKVPVLVDGEQVVTENVAIAYHLAQRFPGAGLMPREPRALAQALSLMSWCASGLHPLVTRLRLPQRFCDLPQADARVRALAGQEMAAQLAVADERLERSPWLMGDDWCAADAYLFWVCTRSSDSGFDLAPWPHLAAHGARMRERAPVARALAREEQAA